MKTTRRGLLGLFAGGAAAATGVGKAVASGGKIEAGRITVSKIDDAAVTSEHIGGTFRSRDGRMVMDFDAREFRWYD